MLKLSSPARVRVPADPCYLGSTFLKVCTSNDKVLPYRSAAAAKSEIIGGGHLVDRQAGTTCGVYLVNSLGHGRMIMIF